MEAAVQITAASQMSFNVIMEDVYLRPGGATLMMTVETDLMKG